jgi:mannitol-1-phosphate 5-dehydrogenase
MVSEHIVIWGAGRIGRGFVADLAHAAEYRIVLVDSAAELVTQLNAAGSYTVVWADADGNRDDRIIGGYTAISTTDAEAIAAAIATADVLAVAVFPRDLPSVAEQMAPGIVRRLCTRPDAALDILMCTNLAHAAGHFDSILGQALPPEFREPAARRLGFVDTLVMRMVTDPPAEERERDPLLIWTNGFSEFPVDGHAFKGQAPRWPGLRLAGDMQAEEMRKLYTYNMCHALLAYLGALRGYTLAVECLADRDVRRMTEGALNEISRALQAACGFRPEDMERWIERVLAQTDNAALRDQVARHGADPRRKLRRGDRLVGPALLARAHGIRPEYLALGIAAALLFQAPGDAGAAYVQARIAETGVEAAVWELCELAPGEEDLAEMIVAAYRARKIE